MMNVLRAMPDSTYDFRPNQDVRSFKALAYHVVYSIEWNLELMKGKPTKWISGGEDRMTKKELIKYWDAQFDKLLAFIKDAEETPELIRLLMS